MKATEPWLNSLSDILEDESSENKKRHQICAYNLEDNTEMYMTWHEFLKFKFSREFYKYSVTFPLNQECFKKDLGIWNSTAEEIARRGFHEIHGYSWDRDWTTREIIKFKIAFCISAGEGPDEDGFGRTGGTYLACEIDGQGNLIEPFGILYR